ncbi:SIS domain-containing protein [Lactobacillus sp. ESL0791]|uniref:SIS domain-containing protein n=1 Tax=Lactobacillus sp. ESL0791 TaxID=2983234 RepID=UPI0023F799DD|nr:SIS domain-containing protein [Lactobacillus sp. ESL0791]MDF7639246.1 SIS domain-containing protein [Lactobacillus sp. ESL0791]
MYHYIERIKQIWADVEKNEQGKIEQAIDTLVKANADHHSIYVFGASHAGILAEEMYYRAGGMITMNAIFGKEVMLNCQPITSTSKMERLEGYGSVLADNVKFQSEDVLILHSVSGRNPIIIDMALAAKKQGVTVIGLTNLQYSQSVTSRHSSGKRLFEVADIVIDNHGDVGDGACTIEGAEQKVGPTSTVIGASILNTIIVETCQRLAAAGKPVPVFYSANLDDGDAKNQQLISQFKDVIHYQF